MKKTLLLLLLVVPFLLAACSKEDDSGIKSLSEVELAAGQELITGQVTTRVGNDLELALGTLVTTQNMGAMPSGEAGTMPSGEAGAMPSGEAGAMPSGEAGAMPSGEAGAMPSGEAGAMPSGETGARPSGGGGQSGTMPSGGGGQDGAMPSGDTAAAASGDTATTTVVAAQISLSGETMSISIPVGTTVLVTSNEVLTESSFGRIQADDILQLILQTNSDGTQTVLEAQIME